MNRRRLLVAAAIILLFSLTVLRPISPSSRETTPQAECTSVSKETCRSSILDSSFPRTQDCVPILAHNADSFATELNLPAPDPKSRWRNPAKPVLTTFPENFADPVRVRCGVADVFARPLNANAAKARTLPDGSLVYENAFDNADVHYRCSAYKTEEFIVIREGESTRTFKWRLDLNAGEKPLKPRLTPAHTIELCDEQGVPRLRINAPIAKDATGRVLREDKELCYAINADELTLSADLRGCEFPVVIDPTWSSTGTMGVARWRFGFTQLQDGRVLACGGQNSNSRTTEIFDPSSETWASMAPMAADRAAIKAVLLDTGSVLVAGGSAGVSDLSTAELYNPTSNTWSPATSLNSPRSFYQALRLTDGRILVVGGSASTYTLFTPGANTWSTDANLVNAAYYGTRLTRLQDGRVLATGLTSGTSSVAEIFDPTVGPNGTWTAAAPMTFARSTHTSLLLDNGEVLVAGGFNGNSIATSERYNPSANQWTALSNLNQPRENLGSAILGGRVFCFGGVNGSPSAVVSSACDELISGTNWVASFPLNQARQEFEVIRLDAGRVMLAGGVDQQQAPLSTCELFVLDDLPQLSLTASPTILEPGESVFFSLQATDPDGDVLSFLWDFGDGTSSTEKSPVHAYAAEGTYQAKVIVTDAPGLKSTVTVTVKVVSGRPTARFTTSDVVGFVGQPVTFDASLSTDPENDITAYSWNFGDGSPAGSKQVLSKIYNAVGTYSVTLTVTDGEGLTSASTRNIVILPADQQGLFNSIVTFKVRWDRNKTNADTLGVDATVNVGDAVVAAGTNVAIEIATQRFESTLDPKLKAKTATQSFTVTAGTRRQSAGEVRIRLTAKKASLGAGFNSSGVVAGNDPSEFVEASVPMKIEIAGRVFEVLLDSEFKFSKDGRKASGSGDGP